MIEKRVARRYGNALFAIATEDNKIAEWQKELNRLTDLLQSDSQFSELIYGKFLTAQAKKETLTKILGSEADVKFVNFLHLLIDKNREDYLPEIKESFDQLVDEAQGFIEILVTAPTPLNSDEEMALTKTLADITKKQVRLAVNVDKELIGGLKVQVGDIVYDGSVAQQLKKLRASLAK